MATTAAASRNRCRRVLQCTSYRQPRASTPVERNRILTGAALGYEPEGAPDFGLDRATLATPGPRYAIFSARQLRG